MPYDSPDYALCDDAAVSLYLFGDVQELSQIATDAFMLLEYTDHELISHVGRATTPEAIRQLRRNCMELLAALCGWEAFRYCHHHTLPISVLS